MKKNPKTRTAGGATWTPINSEWQANPACLQDTELSILPASAALASVEKRDTN